MHFPADFLHLCQDDFSGILRGRTICHPAGEPINDCKTGWIPSNALITFFGALTPLPDVEIGDLRFVPALEEPISVRSEDGLINSRLLFGKFLNLDGSPWTSCTRTLLENTIAQLRSNYELELEIGLELEFYLLDNSRSSLNAYSLESFIEEEALLAEYAGLLIDSGVGLDSIHSENGNSQYELTLSRTSPMEAADQLVLSKAIGQLLATKRRRHLSFAPIVDQARVGSGLHIHFSLRKVNGQPCNLNSSGKVSELAGAFLNGLLSHLGGLLAFTSPSVISPMRYRPPRWTAYYNNFAEADRKAAIRLTQMGEGDQATHFEMRTADASANAYLMLAGLIQAGMLGLEKNVTEVPVVPTSSAQKNQHPNIHRLPDTLEDCLHQLEHDVDFMKRFDHNFLRSYLAVKHYEVRLLHGRSEAELIQLHTKHY
jgi:glutamine synthetase